MSKAALDRPGIGCINLSTSRLRKDPLNSGNTELDTYLKRNAKLNARLRTARTFVALFCEDNDTRAGYYAGSANLLDRKQPEYKPPDSFVEREKSSESSSRTPGFISGVAFSYSLISNLKSQISNRLIVPSYHPALRENLPNYPPPAMLVGKLAVDRSMQGRR